MIDLMICQHRSLLMANIYLSPISVQYPISRIVAYIINHSVLIFVSSNEGKDWTEPLKVSDDILSNHRVNSMFLEKDTDRVYIVYSTYRLSE
jgi:hypothetical protein